MTESFLLGCIHYLKSYKIIIMDQMLISVTETLINDPLAKSRNYQGVFKVKIWVKTWPSSRNLVSRFVAQVSLEKGKEPGVRKGKRSLLAYHTRWKCSMETTHSLVRLSSVSRSWNWRKVWSVEKSLLVKGQNVI